MEIDLNLVVDDIYIIKHNHNDINKANDEILNLLNKVVGVDNRHDYEMLTNIDYRTKHRLNKKENKCQCGNTINIIDNAYICTQCGLHHGYQLISDYIDFHANKFKIYHKSIYDRKYHILNKLLKYELSVEQTNNFLAYLKQIVNSGIITNKRFIKFDYIFKQIFVLMELPEKVKQCPQIKTKQTLKNYDRLWQQICDHNKWVFCSSCS
jgi:hypothetical protein